MDRKKELEWADRARDDAPEDYEPTYRDGSVRAECWNPGDYGAPTRPAAKAKAVSPGTNEKKPGQQRVSPKEKPKEVSR